MRSRKLSRRMRALTAAAAVALVSGVSFAVAGDGSGQKGQQGNASYTIGLFGDMPYNAQGKADYPFLLQDINEGRVAFSMFEATSRPAGIQRQLPVPRHRRREPAAAQRGDRAQGREPALDVVPEHVGSSGPPWRLSAVKGSSAPRRSPDESSR